MRNVWKYLYLKRPFQIKITNVSSKSYVDFLEMNSSISTNGALSLYINAVQDVSNLHAKVVILVLSSSGNYDLVLANTTVDVCEFYRNKKYVPILQMFYRTFTKTGTFPKSCPIRKVKISDNFFRKVLNFELFRICTSSKML